MDIKVLYKGAEHFLMPKKATDGSAAYDVYVQEDTIIEPGRQAVKLGFAMALDKHTAAEIHPRSGHSLKGMEGYSLIRVDPDDGDEEDTEFVSLASSRFDASVMYGLIDSDYRNEVCALIYNHDDAFMVKRGTRIAQMLIVPVLDVAFEEVEELSETDRKGGFGSTDTKNN